METQKKIKEKYIPLELSGMIITETGEIIGESSDDQGTYTVEGKILPSGSFSFVQNYDGGHTVTYNGRINHDEFEGKWKSTKVSKGTDHGTFNLAMTSGWNLWVGCYSLNGVNHDFEMNLLDNAYILFSLAKDSEGLYIAKGAINYDQEVPKVRIVKYYLGGHQVEFIGDIQIYQKEETQYYVMHGTMNISSGKKGQFELYINKETCSGTYQQVTEEVPSTFVSNYQMLDQDWNDDEDCEDYEGDEEELDLEQLEDEMDQEEIVEKKPKIRKKGTDEKDHHPLRGALNQGPPKSLFGAFNAPPQFHDEFGTPTMPVMNLPPWQQHMMEQQQVNQLYGPLTPGEILDGDRQNISKIIEKLNRGKQITGQQISQLVSLIREEDVLLMFCAYIPPNSVQVFEMTHLLAALHSCKFQEKNKDVAVMLFPKLTVKVGGLEQNRLLSFFVFNKDQQEVKTRLNIC